VENSKEAALRCDSGLRQRLYFEQDSAPAENGEDARQWLKASLPGRWVEGSRSKYVDS